MNVAAGVFGVMVLVALLVCGWSHCRLTMNSLSVKKQQSGTLS